MKHIAIIDFGSQYTHLIARSVREQNVLAKIYNPEFDIVSIKDELDGIILSGGPLSVYNDLSPKINKKILSLSIPILGICYGHQLLAHLLGGKVIPGKSGEYGKAHLNITDNSPLFNHVNNNSIVWMSHWDEVSVLPQGFKAIAGTNTCPITAMANEEKKIYGLQFHPEVEHSEQGGQIIKNFVLNICRAKKNWYIKDLIGDLEKKIIEQVKDRNVFILVSGGVDSNVAFALLTKALGKERVHGLYIDTGFMRQGESKEIKTGYEKAGLNNFTIHDASETFFKRLKNIYEPEKKRHIIGEAFLDTRELVANKLNLDVSKWMLGQGTIYPDTIETKGTKNADRIKTHHNRVDRVKELIEKNLVVEPLIEFYKDEVRQIGKLLDLPENLIKRHPFPGPGLAIQCLCHNIETPRDNLNELEQKVDLLYKAKIKNIKYRLLPIKSVGVQGDNRTYAHPLVIWGENDWEKLDKIATTTTNSVKGVNRVILLLNPKEQNDSHLEVSRKNLHLTRKRILILQKIHQIVINNIKKYNIYNDIWEFPAVLIPIVDSKGKESVVLRPINSRDVMTLNFYRMEKNILDNITNEILATKEIANVFYDITNKPPGTLQWE